MCMILNLDRILQQYYNTISPVACQLTKSFYGPDEIKSKI